MKIDDILCCLENIRFTDHALAEMFAEEFGEITSAEVVEALKNGSILEVYTDDKPFPSCLVFGSTRQQRTLHVVCAPVAEEQKLIIITTYQPDPERWIDLKWRKS